MLNSYLFELRLRILLWILLSLFLLTPIAVSGQFIF